MDLRIFTTLDDFVKASTDLIAETCEIENPKIGLSGGSTPGPVYKGLSKRQDINFKDVDFFQVDERYIDATDDRSNYKLIITNIPEIKLHSFDTSLPIEECIKDYEEKLNEYLTRPLDLCILGIGTDGHFASIFPNSKALNEKEHPAVHTQTEAHEIKDRLTLTMPVIMQSRQILVLLKGNEKWELIQKLNDNSLDPDEFPARHLINHHNLIIHYLKI